MSFNSAGFSITDSSDFSGNSQRTCTLDVQAQLAVLRQEMSLFKLYQCDFDSICRRNGYKRPCDKHVECRYSEPRRWAIYGIGRYCCSTCNHEWKSGHSWVTIDLLRQKIERSYGQQCRQCQTIFYNECFFDYNSWSGMIRKLLRLAATYLLEHELVYPRRARILRSNLKIPNVYSAVRSYKTPIHDAFRCEFCQQHGVVCTKYDFHYFSAPEFQRYNNIYTEQTYNI